MSRSEYDPVAHQIAVLEGIATSIEQIAAVMAAPRPEELTVERLTRVLDSNRRDDGTYIPPLVEFQRGFRLMTASEWAADILARLSDTPDGAS